MSKQELPSPDILLAEVITEHCPRLQERINLGLEQNMGIFYKDNVPFVFHLTWEKEGVKLKFHLEVFQVRPRSLKLAADRYFDSV